MTLAVAATPFRKYRVILDHLFAGQVRDSYQRSIVKTLSWRLLAACDTFAISYFVTGKVLGAATIVGVEGVTKIGWYFLHERGWQHIGWGRIPPPTFKEIMGGLWRKPPAESRFLRLWRKHVQEPVTTAVSAVTPAPADKKPSGETPPEP